MDTRFAKRNTISRCGAAAVPPVEILPVADAALLLAVCLCVVILRITTQIL